jgi:hypothetical protein
VKKKTLCGMAAIICSAVIAASSHTALAADVNVYAEGAYTDTNLVVYIYADITGDPLVSAGVKLSYDKTKFYPVDPATDPAGSAPTATKNETDWYFGTTAGTKYPYQDPQINTDLGEVVFINGKIDESEPTDGVTGTRKLIGKAIFTRTDSADPGTSPETYFGSSLELGVTRTDGGEFANFVTTGEAVLDNSGVSYTVKIRQRGDANADGLINIQDITAVKYYTQHGGPLYPWIDCNGDGVVNVQDMTCVKYEMTN